jgi:hypothetical protein
MRQIATLSTGSGLAREQTKMSKIECLAILAGLILIPVALGRAQETSLAPAYSWDLSVNAEYAARTAKQFSTLSLDDAKITFLDNHTLAVTYADGPGASSSDGTVLASRPRSQDSSGRPQTEHFRKKVESPLYKFHSLIFDVNTGPVKAQSLAWDAIRGAPQFLPAVDGSFVVRVDNHFLVYSNSFQLQHELTREYYDQEALPSGDPVFQESFWAGIYPTGRTLVICHILEGRHDGGTQITWYDVKTLDQIGKPSPVSSEAAGCRNGFNVTEQTAYSGYYLARSDQSTWKKINPWCINCTTPVVFRHKYINYDLLDEAHVFLYGKDPEVIDFDGNVIYVTSHEQHVRVDKPDPHSPMPHAANAPRLAYDDGQPKDERGHRISKRIHVVDWKLGRKIAVIKVVQDHSPVLRGGGLQLERGNLIDFSYALSPDGRKLAVLSINSVRVYDLP